MSLQLPSLSALVAMTQPDRATLFARWVAMQPTDEVYRFTDHLDCPLSRFGRAITGSSCWAGAWGFVPFTASHSDLPEGMDDICDHPSYVEVLKPRGVEAVALASREVLHTFGALTTRLSHLLTSGEPAS